MKEELLAKLKEMEEKFSFMFADPASSQEIDELERRLDCLLSSEYKAFLGIYGGAMVGAYPIFGVSPVEPMDKAMNTVKLATAKFRGEGWKDVDAAIVISENHAGDPVLLNADGSVCMKSHDGTAELNWKSFDDFLIWCLGGV